jgi:hypothetical protein
MTRSRTIITKKQRTTPKTSDEHRAVPDLETERLARRLAEMVTALTECDPDTATDAVRAILATDASLDPLEIVATAAVAVEARQRGQLRVPGYVRPDDPKRALSARRAARNRVRPPAPVPVPAPCASDGVVIDLRAEHARVHLDLTRPEVT